MREQLIKALLAHAQGDIAKHKANIEVYLANPVGIGEHSNIVEAIEGVVAGNVDKLKKRYPGGEFNVYQSENRKEGDL